jgi:hypothetical protein
MPTTPEARPGRTPRRDFLRLAALAPLAAGCAALKVGPARQPAAGPSPAASAAPADGLEALRAFPLPPEAEPAAIFRAVVPRGRGG